MSYRRRIALATGRFSKPKRYQKLKVIELFPPPTVVLGGIMEVIERQLAMGLGASSKIPPRPFLSPADVGPFDRPTVALTTPSPPMPEFFTAATAEMTRQLVAGMGISADLLRPTEADRVEKLLGPVPEVKCGRECGQVTTCTKLGRCVDREPPKPIVADRADPTAPLPHLSSRRRMK